MTKRVRFDVHVWSQDPAIANMVPADTGLNYFTCTLGEAATWNADHPHSFHTVNHLIDVQAEVLRQNPAVNFPGGCFTDDGRAIKSGGSPFTLILHTLE
jgi:hypothetical protein